MLVAVVDQAVASRRRESDAHVRRTLSWVCRAMVEDVAEDPEDALVVDAAIEIASRALPADSGN